VIDFDWAENLTRTIKWPHLSLLATLCHRIGTGQIETKRRVGACLRARARLRSGGCFIYRGAPARASGRSITHFAAPPGALEVTAEAAAPLYKWWGQTAFYGLAGGDLVAHNSTGQLLEERPAE
jgi:hypothetical protein